jgi:anti-sigma regulatory factor (Ser/Thr protein kinase)
MTERIGVTAPPQRTELSRTCSRTFPGRADQVAAARTYVAGFLGECPVTDDVVLISSELATNAVMHSASGGPGGWFAISVAVSDQRFAWVEVEDQGGLWATGQHGLPDGHGLSIVAALAEYWSVRGDSGGRVVNARVGWP